MKLAELGLKSKPQTKYFEGGYVSFSTDEDEQSMKGCEFNPKNLPTTKNGKCENPDHGAVSGTSSKSEKLQLIMMFSEEYIDNWCDCSKKYELSDEEYDKKFDEMEKIQFKPDSEAYYCKICTDDLVESSC